jgi:hypothetical protein
MATQEEINQIEISNDEAKKVIEKSEALKRLMDNEDYKLIILEGFLNEYPKELGLAIAKNTGAYDSDKLTDLLKGVNSFVGYTHQVVQNGLVAEQTIKDNEEFIKNSVSDEG